MSTCLVKIGYRFPLRFVFLLITLALMSTGCKSDPNESFIQGIWYYNDEHLRTIPAESQQETNWLFERKTFQNYSCCFAEINMRGSYRILKSEDNTLQLELFNITGEQGGMTISDQTTISVTIVIDEENDTLKINRAGPFTRLTPK